MTDTDIPAEPTGARLAAPRVHVLHWDRRLGAWATKTYGPQWITQHEPERLEAEFRAWLRRNGDDD